MTSRRFDGQVALVTGAARGQGEAEAVALAAEGAFVVVADIDVEAGQATASALQGMGSFCNLDVAVAEDWTRAVSLAEAHGPLTMLVNNAGIFCPAPLEETTAELFNRHSRVNQLGPLLGMQAVVPAMRRAGGGSIVNVASTAGLRGAPGMIAYTASKWALRGMTKAAAAELGQHSIRVNSVHPCLIETGMTAFIPASERAAYAEKLPLGRLPTIDEVVSAVLFLLSDASASMTGAELKIDSGSVL